MKVKIFRTEKDEGMFGVMLIDEECFCRTIEKPWIDNIPYESCIPEGKYTCRRIHSGHFGNTFEVTDVPGRTSILFHWGSFVTDYKGCIGVGKRKGKIGHRTALYNTKDTFSAFLERTKDIDEFELEIKNV